MSQAINYIQWVCVDKRTWSLEPINTFKKCYYRKKNRSGIIACENPNCNGDFPNQDFRDFLSKTESVMVK